MVGVVVAVVVAVAVGVVVAVWVVVWVVVVVGVAVWVAVWVVVVVGVEMINTRLYNYLANPDVPELENPTKCETCNGAGAFLSTGADPGASEDCETCWGRGEVEDRTVKESLTVDEPDWAEACEGLSELQKELNRG